MVMDISPLRKARQPYTTDDGFYHYWCDCCTSYVKEKVR